MFKRLFIIILISSLMLFIYSPFIAAQSIPDPQFDLKAKSAILMEAKSGRILFKKDSNEKLPPASITKIMTLLLTMEAIDEGRAKLDDMVSTSEHAASMGGSQIWLEPGEELTLENMIKAIAIVSANDACVAVAEYLYGTDEAFVNAMNKKAKELDMKGTYFMNTNGLPPSDPEIQGNHTSANDVALMSRELINKYPRVLDYTGVWIDHLRDGDSFLRNTNNLVRFYKGADGLKTGYTSEAGYCVSATAQREGLRFVAVVMQEKNSKVRFNEAGKLLSYGFNLYRSIKVVKKGDLVIDRIEIYKAKNPMIQAIAKEDLMAAVFRGNEDKLKRQVVIHSDLVAPLKKGDKVGELRVVASDKVIASVDLVANRDVEKGNILQIIIQLLKKFFMNIVNLFN
ncbi:D-alanyl-D-alanine carboxypeptidase family protein [Selenihalanaerobacter shriftii]|uniref:serine-type D-Ala-D-Ala carboxypeptidase n=1 Tax=Selenihalanaerobacter shriftii TaxID=142842 RepID=A0A1T4M5F8_9FIRM|nr:D-alanyl-D-alanine carboxypeptidase family protein [Selenihalanaerobacter shriftii]SJZ62107.1 D-Ala-D-Ala carboxypeptidase DacF. Serine peptidase. MEROPS family S11 [Selenihalanaerobacter shriftii]